MTDKKGLLNLLIELSEGLVSGRHVRDVAGLSWGEVLVVMSEYGLSLPRVDPSDFSSDEQRAFEDTVWEEIARRHHSKSVDVVVAVEEQDMKSNVIQVGQVVPDVGEIRKIVMVVKVLHTGWEMDNEAWLVEIGDKKFAALTTDHGRVVPWSIEDMQAKMMEARASMMGIAELIAMTA